MWSTGWSEEDSPTESVRENEIPTWQGWIMLMFISKANDEHIIRLKSKLRLSWKFNREWREFYVGWSDLCELRVWHLHRERVSSSHSSIPRDHYSVDRQSDPAERWILQRQSFDVRPSTHCDHRSVPVHWDWRVMSKYFSPMNTNAIHCAVVHADAEFRRYRSSIDHRRESNFRSDLWSTSTKASQEDNDPCPRFSPN